MTHSKLTFSIASGLLFALSGCGGADAGGLGTTQNEGGSAGSSSASGGEAPSAGRTSGGASSSGGNTSAGGATTSGGANGGGVSTSGGATAAAGAGQGGTTSVPGTGLHVEGPQIKNAQGDVVTLHGVNRSGTEYRCIQSATSIFDGPSDDASIQVISTWKVNAVRVPLNESCWLAINGAAAATSGDNYKTAIKNYVALLEKHNMTPILELHWVGPGTNGATRQQPMPDADHAPAFWTDVASTFKGDLAVVLELYNEPFPDSNRNTTAAWTCWRDGCTANLATQNGGGGTYMATGMQALLNAVRQAGAENLVLLGGIQYSNTLDQWQTYMPMDPMANVAAAWHIYTNNACNNQTCWSNAPAKLAMSTPIVVTELGENDCMGSFVTPLMQWLDGKSISYLAWAWDAYGACQPAVNNQGGQPWSLVSSYTTGAPNGGFAQAVHDHLLGL